jgi:hypothetical protein
MTPTFTNLPEPASVFPPALSGGHYNGFGYGLVAEAIRDVVIER